MNKLINSHHQQIQKEPNYRFLFFYIQKEEKTMKKNEIFKKAHKMTKEVIAEFPDLSYRAQFSICLKEVYREIKANANSISLNKVLGKKEVVINNIPRTVALKIEGNKIFGVLNNTRFIWAYAQHELPILEKVKEGHDKLKASKYGRLFILERLKMEGINLPIKSKDRRIEYLHLDTKDGVWCNIFENGYIRGAVDCIHFSWNPAMHNKAIAVSEAGFKGSITDVIDTNRIKARLGLAGYNSLKALMEAVNNHISSKAV